MHERPIMGYCPGVERLEQKRPLSTGASPAALANPKVGPEAVTSEPSHLPVQKGSGVRTAIAQEAISPATATPKPNYGYLVYRITNPNRFNNTLTPPFSHVLVQPLQPVAGQTYNVLYVAVRNGTLRTFDASSGFSVRFPGDPTTYPILTGTEQWKPGQEFVFYVLTKTYYPLPSEVHSAFEFDLGGARSIAIPGPSGIFLRVKYNPATFDRILDWIVAYGPGAQGGKGIKFGLPDTAINEFVSAATNRSDFGGYF